MKRPALQVPYLIFPLLFFLNNNLILGQTIESPMISEPVYERIPAQSFYRTHVTFLFAPSFEKDSNQISSWNDGLYLRADIAENRFDSDLLGFTLQNRKLNRNDPVKFQGHTFMVELDSKLVANSLIKKTRSEKLKVLGGRRLNFKRDFRFTSSPRKSFAK